MKETIGDISAAKNFIVMPSILLCTMQTISIMFSAGLEIHFLVVANFCYQVQDQVAKLIVW